MFRRDAAGEQHAGGGEDETGDGRTGHTVSGTADFIAEVVVPNLKAYERLLSEKLLTLPMVGDIRSNFALSRVKSDGALPLTHLKRDPTRPEPARRPDPDCGTLAAE